MGYALGWVAVQGGRADAIHEQLGVLSTGTREDVPEAPVVGAILPNGWYLVAVQRGEHLLGDALLSDLSAGTHAIACFVEEHVMYIGRALLKAVETEAIQRGCCKITLEVQDANRQARGLYEHYGFADFVIGNSPTRFLCKLLDSRP